MVNALPFICQTDRVVQKVSNVTAADWRYQTNKKLSQIYAFPQGWKSLLNTVIYTLNNNIAQYISDSLSPQFDVVFFPYLCFEVY